MDSLKSSVKVPYADIIQHVMKIGLTLVQKEPDYWSLQKPLLSLITTQLTRILEESSGGEKNQKLVQFVSLLLPTYEGARNINTDAPLEPGEKLRVIKKLL